jgi:hypothetical protein
MVTYVKEWNGKKKTSGSQVGAWEPAVATLPDLSIMESLTYVNEIDVRKLRVGQDVKVTLDADPSKALIGKVKQVANVGEQRPNADAKVFEVVVNIEKPDTSLRPGMTTGNEVSTQSLKDVLYIPLDALVVEKTVDIVDRERDGVKCRILITDSDRRSPLSSRQRSFDKEWAEAVAGSDNASTQAGIESIRKATRR